MRYCDNDLSSNCLDSQKCDERCNGNQTFESCPKCRQEHGSSGSEGDWSLAFLGNFMFTLLLCGNQIKKI